MKEIRTATEHEMVLAFLRAELDSPRFSEYYRPVFAHFRVDPAVLIERGDASDAMQNTQRIEILGAVRGYKKNHSLFTGFPNSVQWTEGEIQPDEIGELTYAKWPSVIRLSAGTRRVADGAKNIDTIIANDLNTNIKALAQAVRNGKRCPELILARAAGGPAVLIEGHARATAYVLAKIDYAVRAFIGTSQMMSQWSVY